MGICAERRASGSLTCFAEHKPAFKPGTCVTCLLAGSKYSMYNTVALWLGKSITRPVSYGYQSIHQSPSSYGSRAWPGAPIPASRKNSRVPPRQRLSCPSQCSQSARGRPPVLSLRGSEPRQGEPCCNYRSSVGPTLTHQLFMAHPSGTKRRQTPLPRRISRITQMKRAAPAQTIGEPGSMRKSSG